MICWNQRYFLLAPAIVKVTSDEIFCYNGKSWRWRSYRCQWMGLQAAMADLGPINGGCYRGSNEKGD